MPDVSTTMHNAYLLKRFWDYVQTGKGVWSLGSDSNTFRNNNEGFIHSLMYAVHLHGPGLCDYGTWPARTNGFSSGWGTNAYGWHPTSSADHDVGEDLSLAPFLYTDAVTGSDTVGGSAASATSSGRPHTIFLDDGTVLGQTTSKRTLGRIRPDGALITGYEHFKLLVSHVGFNYGSGQFKLQIGNDTNLNSIRATSGLFTTLTSKPRTLQFAELDIPAVPSNGGWATNNQALLFQRFNKGTTDGSYSEDNAMGPMCLLFKRLERADTTSGVSVCPFSYHGGKPLADHLVELQKTSPNGIANWMKTAMYGRASDSPFLFQFLSAQNDRNDTNPSFNPATKQWDGAAGNTSEGFVNNFEGIRDIIMGAAEIAGIASERITFLNGPYHPVQGGGNWDGVGGTLMPAISQAIHDEFVSRDIPNVASMDGSQVEYSASPTGFQLGASDGDTNISHLNSAGGIKFFRAQMAALDDASANAVEPTPVSSSPDIKWG